MAHVFRFSFFTYFSKLYFFFSFFVHIQKITALAPQTPRRRGVPRKNNFIILALPLSLYSIQPLPSFHFFFAKEIPKSTKLIKQALTKAYIRLLFFFLYLRIYVSSFCIFCWLYHFVGKFSWFHLSDLLYFAYTFFVSFLSRNSVVLIFIAIFSHRSKAQPRNSIISK